MAGGTLNTPSRLVRHGTAICQDGGLWILDREASDSKRRFANRGFDGMIQRILYWPALERGPISNGSVV
jgi:hypothetical protein